ncbi:MAG: hypothetical protein D6696_00135 [Acidobacteria bacterium]|nr:MAG: hypothetical protein D6696_00135 [Acidobacteriota bacterium]
MAGMRNDREPTIWLEEGVEVRYLAAAAREAEVARLTSPWIAGEGPLDARLEQGAPAALLPRGLAFDDETTVAWDEDAVQVVRPAPPAADVVALAQPVLIRQRVGGPEALVRIDYVRHGVWLASRYLARPLDDLRRT